MSTASPSTLRVVATAGHVDHGKSSLVQALTGTNPDRFEEERRRGLTIDLGFAHTVLAGGQIVSFIDVPGHVRFLRNMLAGVGGVDCCLFVVAATEGWKPQSEEHLRILQLLGLRHGIVALSKADLVDDEWRELQTMDVRDHLAGTFLEDAPIVAVSAHTGAGLEDLRVELGALIDRTPVAADGGRPRLWVDRSFAAKGSGTVVTGTLTGGALTIDQHVTVAGRDVRVRGIQSHGERLQSIGPGNRVALNLNGVDHDQVHRGDAVIVPGQWRPSMRVDASLRVLADLGHQVSRRGAYVAYVGSGEWPVRVRVIGAASIGPGGDGLVRLHLPSPLALLPGDRFILRESGRDETVGGGEILDVAPVRPASKATPDRDVDRVIAERGWVAVDELDALTGVRRTPTVPGWVVAPAALAASVERAATAVAEAGALGLDIATLGERERLVLAMVPDIRVDAGRAFPREAVDPLAGHPFVAALDAGGVTPPDAADVPRAELRELIRRGLIVERDGVWFHPTAIDAAGRAAAGLLAEHPDGFTVAQLRDALGTSRKFVLPIVNELDARGVTRRRGDLRIGGPRLPT